MTILKQQFMVSFDGSLNFQALQGSRQGGPEVPVTPPPCKPFLTKQPTTSETCHIKPKHDVEVDMTIWWIPSLWHSVTPPLKISWLRPCFVLSADLNRWPNSLLQMDGVSRHIKYLPKTVKSSKNVRLSFALNPHTGMHHSVCRHSIFVQWAGFVRNCGATSMSKSEIFGFKYFAMQRTNYHRNENVRSSLRSLWRNRSNWLTRCCTQFEPFGNQTFCFMNFHVF